MYRRPRPLRVADRLLRPLGSVVIHAVPRRKTATLLTAVLIAAAPAAFAAKPLVAARITAENYATHHVGGPDAEAGVGDWFLSNGTICAAVTAADHESGLMPDGGVLTDLGHCGRDDDQWVALQPLVNFSQRNRIRVSSIASGTDDESAWIQTRAVFEGVEILTTYSVGSERPLALDVETEARRTASGEDVFSYAHLVFHPSGQTPVFVLSRARPTRSAGFVFPPSDYRSITSLMSALIPSDLTILVGSEGLPPVSYGVERRSVESITRSTPTDTDRTIESVGSFSVSGHHFTLMSSLVDAPWFGDADEAPGLARLAQIAFMDLDEDETLRLEYRIHVGERSDVASITNRVWNYGGRVSGRIDDTGARIHIDRASGGPMTEIRPDAKGRFALRLPKGDYRVRAVADADRQTEIEFSVTRYDEAVVLPEIDLGTPARIHLPDSFTGRLLFFPSGPDQAPLVFGSNLLGQRMGPVAIPGHNEAPWVNLAGSPFDPGQITVPPGSYRILATRGPEYEVIELETDVVAGETVDLEIAPLARVAPTPGFIATDYHVHSGTSFDSGVAPVRQYAAFAASGAEVLVATEHDRIVDPRPALRAAGLGDRLRAVTGLEATSAFEGGDSPYTTGHLNAFPMQPEKGAYRGGAPSLEGRRLRDILADLRQSPTNPFVQLNHPRPGALAENDGFFSTLGFVGEPFDPAASLSEYPNSVLVDPGPTHGVVDLDFHGVEVMNGSSMLRYRRVRADWLSLLLQGVRIIGTANSDSHRLGVPVGLPRTYVAQVDDSISAFDEDAHFEALRAGRAWGTTGPLVRVHLRGEGPEEAGLGGLHTGDHGTLEISVDAAPWVPIEEWRAYVNGELVHQAAISRGESASLPLVFQNDSIVTVEVEGEAKGAYAEIYPGFTPFAFTNPIFVDADRNGRFDAPGLPLALPRTLTNPDEAE